MDQAAPSCCGTNQTLRGFAATVLSLLNRRDARLCVWLPLCSRGTKMEKHRLAKNVHKLILSSSQMRTVYSDISGDGDGENGAVVAVTVIV